jgi:hypothetical protein
MCLVKLEYSFSVRWCSINIVVLLLQPLVGMCKCIFAVVLCVHASMFLPDALKITSTKEIG